jgi:hypothetical protein
MAWRRGELGAKYYDERKKAAVVRNVVKRLESSGLSGRHRTGSLTPTAAGRTTFYGGGQYATIKLALLQ